MDLQCCIRQNGSQKLLTSTSDQRVSQVSGKAVKAALLELVTNTKGDSVRYTRADIRYDAERGLLELRRAGAKGSGSGSGSSGSGSGV
jgi:hypothetical protein